MPVKENTSGWHMVLGLVYDTCPEPSSQYDCNIGRSTYHYVLSYKYENVWPLDILWNTREA